MLDLPLVAIAVAPLAYRAHDLGLLQTIASTPLGLRWIACLAGVSLLYGLHAFIWHRPKAFTSLCARTPLLSRAHPVEAFAALEIVGKLWQAGCLLALLGLDGGLAAAEHSLAASPLWVWAVFALYVCAGQGLNMAMYASIGNAGVYYGWKLGRPVPWCTAFPFNVGLRHPQYVGVVLTIFGGTTVLMSEATVRAGLVQAALAWAGMYVVMSVMEQWADANASAKKAR